MRFGLERMHRLTTALGHAAAPLRPGPRRRQQRQVLDGPLHRRAPRAPRPAHRQLHLAAPRPLPRADRGGGGGRSPPTASPPPSSAPPRPPSSSSAPQPEGDRVTQFEALTAAAFHELAASGVEVAVVEAGLGGRYDATNVIPSKVQVLTGVGLEHTRWLGPTDRGHRGREAGGRARPRDAGDPGGPASGGPRGGGGGGGRAACARRPRLVATAGSPPLGNRCSGPRRAGIGRSVVRDGRAGRLPAAQLRVGVRGGRGVPRARRSTATAVESAAAETRIPGRLEIVGERPLTIHDGAHNPAGAAGARRCAAGADRRPPPTRARRQRPRGQGRRRHARPAAPARRPRWSSHAAPTPARSRPATLESLAEQLDGPQAEIVPEPTAAMDRARELAGAAGAVLATGSIYLIADLVRDHGDTRASALTSAPYCERCPSSDPKRTASLTAMDPSRRMTGRQLRRDDRPRGRRRGHRDPGVLRHRLRNRPDVPLAAPHP